MVSGRSIHAVVDEFTEPWLRISAVDGDDARFGERVTPPFRLVGCFVPDAIVEGGRA